MGDKVRIQEFGGPALTDISVSIDAEAGAIYIKVRKGKVYKTLEPEPEVFVDVDKNNFVLGLEILRPAGRVRILSEIAKKFHAPALGLLNPEKVEELLAQS